MAARAPRDKDRPVRRAARGIAVNGSDPSREEDKRNKRFYRRSADGKGMLKELLSEWERLNSSVTRI